MRSIKVGIRLIILMMVGILLISLGRIVSAAENESMTSVRALVAKIKSWPPEPSRQRDEVTEELLRFVARMNQSSRNTFDAETVDEIASLLNHENVGVRSNAAFTLGAIGPRALRSVGALLKALRNAEARSRGTYSSSPEEASIIAALQQLGVCVTQQADADPLTVCDYLLQ